MWADNYECEFCGEPTLNEDCICDECKQEHLREDATLEAALAWGDEEKACIEINGFLVWNSTVQEIEATLKKALTPMDKKHAEAFCMDDWMAFQEWKEKRA